MHASSRFTMPSMIIRRRPILLGRTRTRKRPSSSFMLVSHNDLCHYRPRHRTNSFNCILISYCCRHGEHWHLQTECCSSRLHEKHRQSQVYTQYLVYQSTFRHVISDAICLLCMKKQESSSFLDRGRRLFFRLETIDGSAVEGEDYEPLNEILTFEPNERDKEVNQYYIKSQNVL